MCTGFWMIQRPCILMITFCGSCGIGSHLLSYKLLIVTLIHVLFFLVNGLHIYRFCVMLNWLPLFHVHVSLHHMDFKFELFIGINITVHNPIDISWIHFHRTLQELLFVLCPGSDEQLPQHPCFTSGEVSVVNVLIPIFAFFSCNLSRSIEVLTIAYAI